MCTYSHLVVSIRIIPGADRRKAEDGEHDPGAGPQSPAARRPRSCPPVHSILIMIGFEILLFLHYLCVVICIFLRNYLYLTCSYLDRIAIFV